MSRLDEFTKEEWWDVARQFQPNITPEEFDEWWDEFCEMKCRKELS